MLELTAWTNCVGKSSAESGWTSCEMPRDFVIRHLPKRLRFLEFHMPRMVSSFCIFPLKLNSSFCFSSCEIYRFHDGSLGHLKLKGSSLRFLNHDPNQSALVFDGFSLRPDSFPHKIKDGGYNNITNTNKVSPTQNTPAMQATEMFQVFHDITQFKHFTDLNLFL